ncbi:Exonuclease [Candidatus Magnetomorum sp. HK-1]|nr:Exonuclease [Candidatus Magnetomorum sp. HK-1]
MDEESIQQVPEQNNPFISSSVGDPWDVFFTDVSAINNDAFQSMLHLIKEKNLHPGLPCAALVCGEVGSGKTHFIGRLLRQSSQKDVLYYIAYIQPIEDPEQTFSYLLRELINNLCRPILHSNDTPLDRLVENVFNSLDTSKDTFVKKKEKPDLRSAFKQIKNDTKGFINSGTKRDFNKLKNNLKKLIFQNQSHNKKQNKTGIEIMRKRFPGISKTFFKVLFQYKQYEKKNAAISWFKGLRLDDEDTTLLNVPDRNHLSNKALEEESRRLIDAIGQLFSYFGQTLLVCFDRLENLETDAQIHSLGKMIEFIVDTSRAMIPITFIRGSEWDSKFCKSLNQHVVTRLLTNEFQLKACDFNEAKEILKKRLSLITHDSEFPFSEEMLSQMYENHLYSPRQVIITANHKLKEKFEPSAAKILNKNGIQIQSKSEMDLLLFYKQVERIKQNFKSSGPDKQRLIKAIYILIEYYVPNIQIVPNISKKIDFLATSDILNRRIAAIIDTELNNSSIRSALSHGIKWKQKYPDDTVIYIRDLRAPIPKKWDKTHEMLETFNQSGCHLLLLNESHAPFWYAITELSYTLKESESASNAQKKLLNHIKIICKNSENSNIPDSFKTFRNIVSTKH